MRLAFRVVGGHLAQGTAEGSVELKGDHKRLRSCPTPSMQQGKSESSRACMTSIRLALLSDHSATEEKTGFNDLTDDGATFKTSP